DDLVGDRGDDRRERAADDDRDGQFDDVAPQDEIPEALEHEVSPFTSPHRVMWCVMRMNRHMHGRPGSPAALELVCSRSSPGDRLSHPSPDGFSETTL